MPPATPADTTRARELLTRGMAAAVLVAERRFRLRVSTTPKLRVRIFCPIGGVLLGGVLPAGNHAYISKGSVATAEFRAQLVESGFQRRDPPHHAHTHQYWKVPLTENSAFIQAIKSARALVLSSIVVPDA